MVYVINTNTMIFFLTSFIQEAQKSLLALKSNLQSILSVQLTLEIVAQEYTVALC